MINRTGMVKNYSGGYTKSVILDRNKDGLGFT